MPHPRGLKGCAFFESWELKELTGRGRVQKPFIQRFIVYVRF